jgi:hypothetical protein
LQNPSDLPSSAPNTPVLDISKLSANDLQSLREALGISNYPSYCEQNFAADNQNDALGVFGQPLKTLPNLHVSFDPEDLPGNEVVLDYNNNDIGNDFNAVLFDGEASVPTDSQDLWDLPKLKAPEKGAAVSSSLAGLINTACTAQCDTDIIVSKYKIPENCNSLGAPLVNNEIWRILDKKARSQDRGMADIQNLVATSIVPVIRLAEILKSQIQANQEAKTLMSDIMTILGQVQFNLSLRRRYLIRPNINKKYSNLCGLNTPISGFLFGDDITKEIKNCETGVTLGKENKFRGRGYSNRPFRGGRRGYHSGGGYDPNQRYSPYPQRGQFRGNGRQYGGHRGRRAATATATSSEQSKN